MNRLLIAEHVQPEQGLIAVATQQAAKWLSALRDAHFVECRVVLHGEFSPANHKYLIGLPRLLREDGRLVVDSSQLSPESSQKVSTLISTMGLHALADGTYSKSPAQPAKKAELSIGFQPQNKIDEDALLKDDVIDKKPKVESCATKVKACANCNCGRKKAEEQQTKEELAKSIQEGTAKSNCGNCYLGDAFRCATCPYKGLPAFKPGEKIEIKPVEDISAQAEQGAAKVQGGKVKLEL